MLLEYGVQNFFGFKEGATLNFKVPNKVSNVKGYAQIICIKGKNASGKTNLLKGLSFLSIFCDCSFDRYKPDQLMHLEPFFRSDEPTEFFVDFVVNDITYRYELVLTDREVLRETIFRKSSRKVKIIERIHNKFTLLISEFSALKTMKLRSNVSFISSYKQYDIEEMDSLSDIHTFFRKILFNVGYAGLTDNLPDSNDTSKKLYNNPLMFEFTRDLIVSCDTGVKDIEIKERKDDETGELKYTPFFIHEAEGKENSLL